MPLDAGYRGLPEKLIDGMIIQTPTFVQGFPRRKQSLGIRDESEYTYGYIQGHILALFTTAFAAANGKAPNQEELDEAIGVIARRGAEIRDAIYRAG